MPLRAFFEKADGGTEPILLTGELAGVREAFMNATVAVGMPRLDAKTMDEFVRRIELYQAYVQHLMHNADGPLALDRGMLLAMLGGKYVAACTNASRVTKRNFDAALAKEKAAYEAAQVRRRQNMST